MKNDFFHNLMTSDLKHFLRKFFLLIIGLQWYMVSIADHHTMFAGYSQWNKLNDSIIKFQFTFFDDSEDSSLNTYTTRVAIISPYGSKFNLHPDTVYKFMRNTFSNVDEYPVHFLKSNYHSRATFDFTINLKDTFYAGLKLEISDSFMAVFYRTDEVRLVMSSNQNTLKSGTGRYILKCKVYPKNKNLASLQNQSPTFNKIGFNSSYINTADGFCFNPGALESDGDSIIFYLAPIDHYVFIPNFDTLDPTVFNNFNDNWQSPFSYKMPVSSKCGIPGIYTCTPYPNNKPPIGFYMNPRTGEVLFESVRDEHAPFHIVCKEFRKFNGKYELIGLNEMYFEFKSGFYSSRNTKIHADQFEHFICPGDSLIIPIHTSVSSSNDSSTIFWDENLLQLGGQFQIRFPPVRLKGAHFSWKPDSVHLRIEPYRFTVYSHVGAIPNYPIHARTFLIYVRPKPVVYSSFEVKTCGQISTVIDSTNELPGKWSFQWQILDSIRNVVVSESSKNSNFILPYPGSFTIRLLASNSYSNCPFIQEDSIRVEPFTTFDIPDTSFCSIEKVRITPNNLRGQPPLKYFWKTSFRTDTSDYLIFDNLKDSFVYLTVTDSNNCKYTDSLIPEIRKTPYFEFPFEGIQACIGDTITLKVPSPLMNFPRKWNNETIDSILKIHSPESYSLTVMDTINNCVHADTVTAFFREIPKAQFAFEEVCNPASMKFTYNGTRPEGNAYNITWRIADTLLQGDSIRYTPKGAEWVPLTVIANSFTGCVDTFTSNIPTGRYIKTSFNGQNVCQGDSVHFTNQSQYTLEPNWTWKLGDGNFAFTRNLKYAYSYQNESKTYLVSLKAYNDFCSDSVTEALSLFSNPLSDFYFSSMGKTYQFFAYDSSDDLRYQWLFGDGNSSSVRNPTHQYLSDNGSYTVCLEIINADGCSTKSCQEIQISAGVNDPQKAFSVFPNPTKQIIQVFPLGFDQAAIVEIYTSNGIFLSRLENISQNSHSYALPVLSSGVYYLKIISDDSSILLNHFKLIVVQD